MNYHFLSKAIVPPNYYEDSIKIAMESDSIIVVDANRVEPVHNAARRLGVDDRITVMTIDEFVTMRLESNDSTK